MIQPVNPVTKSDQAFGVLGELKRQSSDVARQFVKVLCSCVCGFCHASQDNPDRWGNLS